MRCHNCNAVIKDERMNFCPECRIKLIKEQNVYVENISYKQQINIPFSITRNKAIWQIEKGEIARQISESEFATLDHVSGLIVHDGTTAIIYIDGKKVCQLNGGVYDFVKQEDIDKVLEQREIKSIFNAQRWREGSLRGTAISGWRWLVRAVLGAKVGERVNGSLNANLDTIDQVIQSLNTNSVISVYLKVDQGFPLVFGTKMDDRASFVPIPIKTKYLDADLGVTLFAQISDFDTFIKYHFINNTSVTTYDIYKELEIYVQNILQDELKDEEIDAYGISPAARDRILVRIKALDTVLHGVQIVSVPNITCSNSDFERFRHLAKELYCSEKELDFLKRTNEFKNRLVCVENEQKIWEAKNDLEIKRILNEINRDGKLLEEEELQFAKLVMRQRRIRDKQGEMEDEKALDDIERTRLLNKEEFEALKQSIKFKEFDRANVDEIMRVQSSAEVAKRKIAVNAEVLKCQIANDSDLDTDRFNAYMTKASQTIEQMDIMEVIYGKQYQGRKQRVLEEQEVASLANRFKNSQMLEDAINANKLIGLEIEAKKTVDDYDLRKRQAEDDFERTRIKKRIEDSIELEKSSLEILKEKQNMSLDAMARLKEMEARAKDQQHAHYIESRTIEINKDVHLANLTHEERIKELEIKKDYTAEQLFVDKLDTNSAAANIYAESYSSAKELNAMREAQKKIDANNDMVVELLKEQLSYKDNDKRQTVDTITNLVQNLTGGLIGAQQDRERENFDRFERIATHRMDEFEGNAQQRLAGERTLKDEYREQMKHEQQRHDVHQDKALSYTTQVTEAGYKSTKSIATKESPVYFVESMGDVPFQLEQLKAFVKSGIIHKRSVIKASGTQLFAGDMSALKDCFQQCSFVVCPNKECGNKINKEDIVSDFCPYCGNEI